MNLKLEAGTYRSVTISILLSARSNFHLTVSAQNSARSKIKECLMRLEDHLKRYPTIQLIPQGFENIQPFEIGGKVYKSGRITVEISREVNRLLTESSIALGLKKSIDASLRLEAHLKRFASIAKVSDVTHRPLMEAV